MSESISSRVGRIISVGVSAIVGAMEGLSPEGVMEEAIREVDEAALEVKAELGKVIASRHMANKRLMEKSVLHEDLNKKIALAVSESRDDLAEAGIARQLDIEAQMPVLRETVDDLTQKETELTSYIAALGAKRREMQEELAKLRAVQAQAGSSTQSTPAGPSSSADKKVSQAASTFERVMARQTGLPGIGNVTPAEQAKLLELDKLNRDNRIKERLMVFKAGREE